MRGTKKGNSTKATTKKNESKKNNESKVKSFLFDVEDSPKAGDNTNNSCVTQIKATEFCPDKPYRLALYVHPSTKRKVDLSDSRVLANLTLMKQNKDKENVNKPKKGRTNMGKENVNVTLFGEENDDTTVEKKSRKMDDTTPAAGEKPSKIQKKSILSYMNTNETVTKKAEIQEDEPSLIRTKSKRVRKSYTKKIKEYAETVVVDEPPSDVVKPETEAKKTVKSKAKKEVPNEEEEFEKWAESINSEFDEIDKFEVSVTYD